MAEAMDPEVRGRRVSREGVEELETILSQAEAMDPKTDGDHPLQRL
jgi:hypothetical protein